MIVIRAMQKITHAPEIVLTSSLIMLTVHGLLAGAQPYQRKVKCTALDTRKSVLTILHYFKRYLPEQRL